MLRDLKKKVVEGRMTTVLTPKEVLSNKEFQTKFYSVQIDGMVLPVKNGYDPSSPGYYIQSNGVVANWVEPSEEDRQYYDTTGIIDFSDAKTIQDVIARNEEIKRQEQNILTSPDNIFKPIIRNNDSATMQALKLAINEKNFDIDKYADIIGPNFNNIKRLLNGDDITLKKLVEVCDKLDIRVDLYLSDAYPGVPNPIGKTIQTLITRVHKND